MKTSTTPQFAATLILFITLALGLAGPAHALDINTASAAELTQLKGIGPKRAQAIVRYRDQHGPFRSAEALLEVPGVGNKVLQDNLAAIELPASPRPEGE